VRQQIETESIMARAARKYLEKTTWPEASRRRRKRMRRRRRRRSR